MPEQGSRLAIVGRGYLATAVRDAARHLEIVVAPRFAVRSDLAEDPVKGALRYSRSSAGQFATLVKSLRGVDAVINAAGAAAPTTTDMGRLHSANAVLPAVVGLAAREAGVRRVVHLSSAAVAGSARVLSDDSPRRPIGPYATSKAAGELGLDRFRDDLEIAIYRPTSIVGRGRHLPLWLAPAVGAALKVGLLSPTEPLPFASVTDVASASAHLAIAPSPPAYCTHPSSGLTVGDLANGNPLPTQHAHQSNTRREHLLDNIVGALLESCPSAFQGQLRRLQLLSRGQLVDARELIASGWLPTKMPEQLRRELFAPALRLRF